MWVGITCSGKEPLIVGSVYRHPNNNLTNFECALISKIRSIKSRQQYIVMGDFHINYANLNSISTLTNYDNHINALGCSQLVNLPTRVTPTTSSVIDHIFVNHAALTCINPAVIQHDFSDHMPVIVEYRKTSIKKEMQTSRYSTFS